MLGTTRTAVIMYLIKLQVDMFLLTLGFLLTYKVYPKFCLSCQMGKKNKLGTKKNLSTLQLIFFH